MRILIINSILYTPQNGVIERVNSIKDTMIHNLAAAFVSQGHNTVLIAAADYEPLCKEEYPYEIIYMKSDLGKLFLPTLLPLHLSLIAFLKKRKNDFDLIISSETFSFNSLFAALFANSRVVVWQELADHNRKMLKLPSKIWYNLVTLFMRSNMLVVPRSLRAQEFAKSFNLRVSNVIIDNAVDSFKLIPSVEKRDQFMVVAGLVKRKNVLSIIEKFRAFIEKYEKCNYKLYIAGEGPERERITNYIEKHQLEANVVCLGNVSHDRLNSYLSQSKALLCDTLQDLNMVSISEAIYVGTPVVTNMIPYSSDIVRKYELGIAKSDWNCDDLYRIVCSNTLYVDNCLKYSVNLSLETIVHRFVGLCCKAE